MADPHPPGGEPALVGSALVRGVRLVPVRGAPSDAERPVDLLVRAGAITRVGADLPRVPGVDEYDAAGRWAVPGLWDQHVHLTQWALRATRLDLSGAAGVAEVTGRVRAHLAAAAAADADLVSGFGFRPATWSEQPTVAALDAVAGPRPVVLVSADLHSGWLNTAALDQLGLARRDTLVTEDEWFAACARLGTWSALADLAERSIPGAVRDAAARGVVGVVDMEFAPNAERWPERVARGVDGLRVRTATYADHLDGVRAARLRTGQPLAGGRGLLTMGPLKVIADGSLNTRTACCAEPYADAAALADPCGRLDVAPDALVALLHRARDAGLAAAVHAIGDAAVTVVVDAFAATGAQGSVEHAQLVRLADLPRMRELGLTASVQPAHLLDDRDVAEQCWPDGAGRCFALRAMADAGLTVVLGSDAPVSPLDPWLAMAAAVHRSGDSRAPWHPEQQLTPAEALAASTDGQPTLGIGSPADLVVLDADPLAPAGSAREAAAVLRRMRVAATFVAGRPTHLDL